MAIPLIVLAIGSVVAGYIGVPHAIGGNNWIERFLEPSFEVHASAGERAAAAEPAAVTAAEQPVHTEAEEDARTELLLMGISSGVAIAGIGIAMFFWLRRPDAAASLAQRFSGLHRLLMNKYYVDEVYDATVVQPIKQVSTGALWKGIDVGLIDGLVNGVGAAVRSTSGTLRRIQTGSIRTYAASLFLGAVLIVGWYLWN
jgi:NADH-quinone oxidoreductase subunit L